MKKLIIPAFILISCILFTTDISFAQTPYQELAPLPGTGDGGRTNAGQYIVGVFNLAISIAGVLAVIMIIYGGIKYMSTEAVSGKGDAKDTIQNAVFGLVLAIGAWLILYTINPRLVEFNLSIPRSEVPIAPRAFASGTGCRGECQFSYTNARGETVSYQACSGCVEASSLGLNLKGEIRNVNGQPAQVNADLGSSLRAVDQTSGNPDFYLSEAWPPTVNHSAQCQYNGSCVDLALNNPTAQSIGVFAANAANQGLRVVYEVSSESQRQAYLNAGLPSNVDIRVIPRVTGEHFSVYQN